jgi:hypothetical protein
MEVSKSVSQVGSAQDCDSSCTCNARHINC